MSLRTAIGAVTLCALGMSPAYADRYLCIAELAAGLSFDEARKKWEPSPFLADSKYIIAEPDESISSLYEFVVTEVGLSSFSYVCVSEFNDAGFIRCDGAFGYFMMNKTSGRFQSHYDYGYIEGPEEDSRANTPYVQIGTCSPF